MANLREIKNRVKSTQNTAKVTSAMQMVSAAKSKIASKEALSIYEFSQKINDIVVKLGPGTVLNSPSNSSKTAIVVVGPRRGFVGQLNNALSHQLSQFVQENENLALDGIGVQKYGAKIIADCGLPVKYNFEDSNDLWAILTLLREYQEVYLLYSRFINLLKSTATIEKILPLDRPTSSATTDDSFLYEPNQAEVILHLTEKLFEAKLLSAILNSTASEHASRMVTMKNATENAQDMIGSLTQKLNKERQNKITQQIIEVASGGKKYEN